jgi:hypothetical protein
MLQLGHSTELDTIVKVGQGKRRQLGDSHSEAAGIRIVAILFLFS